MSPPLNENQSPKMSKESVSTVSEVEDEKPACLLDGADGPAAPYTPSTMEFVQHELMVEKVREKFDKLISEKKCTKEIRCVVREAIKKIEKDIEAARDSRDSLIIALVSKKLKEKCANKTTSGKK